MENLRIDDLSVGDWVCAEQLCGVGNESRLTPPMRVVSLGSGAGGWVNLEIDPEQGDPFEYEPSEIRGVPITTEILEKNGWTNDGMYAFLRIDEHRHLEYYFHEHRLRKYYCGVDEWQNHAKVNDITFAVHCYSVHQLQHALRLARVDKEIKM